MLHFPAERLAQKGYLPGKVVLFPEKVSFPELEDVDLAQKWPEDARPPTPTSHPKARVDGSPRDSMLPKPSKPSITYISTLTYVLIGRFGR